MPADTLEILLAARLGVPGLRGEVKALRERVEALEAAAARPAPDAEAWIDAKAARDYLGVSENTFAKLRWHTSPRLKGYKLGGKEKFKRAELDRFVKLFEVRSQGLALPSSRNRRAA